MGQSARSQRPASMPLCRGPIAAHFPTGWARLFFLVAIGLGVSAVQVSAQSIVSLGLRGVSARAEGTLGGPFPSHSGLGATAVIHFAPWIGIYIAGDFYGGDCTGARCSDVTSSTTLVGGGLHLEYPTQRWRVWGEAGAISGSSRIAGELTDLSPVQIETRTNAGIRAAFGLDIALGKGLVAGPMVSFNRQPINVLKLEEERLTLDYYHWRPVFGSAIERDILFETWLLGIQLTWHPRWDVPGRTGWVDDATLPPHPIHLLQFQRASFLLRVMKLSRFLLSPSLRSH